MTSTHGHTSPPSPAHSRSFPPAPLLQHLRLRAGLLGLLIVASVAACGGSGKSSAARVDEGRQTFRFDTFGDETKWTDALRMHEVVATVDPTTALAVGLKVDADALPAAVVAGIRGGTISLTDPATTVALLNLNAVVGVKGTVETIGGTDRLTRVGFACALCHSTVDNSFAPGIGKRLDGWPNRDLNVGAIVALSPALDAPTKAVFNSWGPGRYDPRFNQDGLNGPQVIPPAYGLSGVHRITSTGDGEDIAYWNRYVGVTQMGGHGTFSDARTGVNVTNGADDLISAKLPGLQAYQLTLVARLHAPRAIAAPSSPTPTSACTRQAMRWVNRNQLEFPATRRAARPGSIGPRR